MLLFAVALSLTLHISLLAAVFSQRIEFPQSAVPNSVQVRLLPANPQQTAIVATAEALIAPVPLAADEEPTPVSEALVSESRDTQNQIAENIAYSEPLSATFSEPQERVNLVEEAAEQEATSRLFVPSVVTVEASLRQIQQQAAGNSRSWAKDCNILEEQSELYSCDLKDQRNYQSLERNHTYETLNPIRELTRSQRTLPTIAENAPALAGRLALADIPEGLSDYLLEEVEAGITLNSNMGNRAVGHMRAMTDKSAAGAMARQILGDAWVVTRAKQLQQRKVHAR